MRIQRLLDKDWPTEKYSVSAPDVEADPYELTNLVGLETLREVANELRERLIRRMVEAGERAPVIEPAEPRPAGERGLTPGEWLRRRPHSDRSPHLSA
jgi:hypothetical protein